MKRTKINTLTQNSKISDFFTKAPNNNQSDVTDNKRKIHDIEQPESSVLNQVTNIPQKCSQKLSPNKKKIKHNENSAPLDDVMNRVSLPNTIDNEPRNTVNNVTNIFQVTTPKKNIKPSESMKTPTPKKTPNSNSKNRTPQSSKKGTPRKLFQKSPKNLSEFNVQIIENFVKVSPSTSNSKIIVTNTPQKKYFQNSSVHSFSPTSSTRCSPAQKINESTPVKSPKSGSSSTPKLKTKLNFTEKVTPKKTDMNNGDHNFFGDIKVEFDNFFQEEFDEDIQDKLNFNTPQHCQILEVECFNEQISLKLKSNVNGCFGFCKVQEFWASGNRFKKGDQVFLQAVKINNDWIVNNQNGWLVYEPDLLIPCTTVVGSLFCKRKSILADRFRGFDSGNRIMVVGILTHKLLQQALKQKLKTEQQIEDLLKSIIHSKETVRTLYESSLSQHEIEAELQVFVPKVVTFINDYINSDLSSRNPDDWQGKICGVDDIEENLWCPELGLKGKIDVTIQTEFGVMPLELKTGRATVSLEHRGQVVMYIMMMNKFGYQVSSGLLLYLREGVLKEIKATPQEQRDIIILRNEMAYFLTRNTPTGQKIKPPELPEPLYKHRACPKCPYNVICTSYLKFEEHDISKNTTILEVQKNATSHLTQSHLDYFLHWSSLLSLEAESQQSIKSIKHIYTTPPEKRELFGRCIINVKIKSVGDDSNGLYEHIFTKEKASTKSLTSCDIIENNYVVVSTNKRPAVATGFVTGVSSFEINVVLDRNLNLKYKDQIFHLDSYDSNITYTFNMTSLVLLLEDTPRSAELRNIIIDKQRPEFLSKLPSVVAKKGASILRRLNPVQQKAVLKALCAKQFLLIKGMPGTGKSATIVALIQLLVELDKSVLVTSHTHSAIDNICTRLQKRGVDFIRLGSESKIDPNIKSHSEATLLEKCESPEEMDEIYNKYKVIAVTCLGSGHPLLSKRTVDFCIVDESTQVVQTALLRPLYAAKTFVLIGDPNQLAPVVRNRDAVDLGMSESLFERLDTSDGTIALNLNYRMNKTITNLANILTYGGELQTANNDVANRTLTLKNTEAITTSYVDYPWVIKAMETTLETAVQLIDTGPVWKTPQDIKLQFKNTIMGESDFQNCVNIYEISIVVTLVKALIEGGVSVRDIGVIATYRAQVSQISNFLEKVDVDISTVDQFQGSDKNVIIYSCTKSTDPSKFSSETSKFELLEDKKRLTVAITRAKRKLLIVGDVSTLQRYKTFSIILPELMKNCIKVEVSPKFLSNFCNL